MGTEFETEGVFDDDYLYFYEQVLTDERGDREAELIWRLGELGPGARVLDLACGHGRLANRLAARGADVTGLDVTERFLEIARAGARDQGLSVDYVHGDVREIPWVETFDAVVNWFTAFGYFDDDENRRVLDGVRRSLRPGGRLLLELNHGPTLMAGFLPSVVTRRGDDAMVDEHTYDASTGRVHTVRTILRDGRTRATRFSTRLFAFPELRDWLVQAGFSHVEGFAGDGGPLTVESRRLVVLAAR
jgi:SAM-dependent methyltransferase